MDKSSNYPQTWESMFTTLPTEPAPPVASAGDLGSANSNSIALNTSVFHFSTPSPPREVCLSFVAIYTCNTGEVLRAVGLYTPSIIQEALEASYEGRYALQPAVDGDRVDIFDLVIDFLAHGHPSLVPLSIMVLTYKKQIFIDRIVKLLTEKQAQIIFNSFCMSGDTNTLRTFLHNLPPYFHSKMSTMNLHRAIRKKNIPLLRVLVDNGANVSCSIAHLALDNEDPIRSEYFQDHPATLLQLLLTGGVTGFKSCTDIITLLSSICIAGADVNLLTQTYQSPLHLLAIFGTNREEFKRIFSVQLSTVQLQEVQWNMAKVLIVSGANIDAQDVLEYTPLHWATHCQEDSLIMFLLKFGANTSIKCNNGQRASTTDSGLVVNSTRTRYETIVYEWETKGGAACDGKEPEWCDFLQLRAYWDALEDQENEIDVKEGDGAPGEVGKE